MIKTNYILKYSSPHSLVCIKIKWLCIINAALPQTLEQQLQMPGFSCTVHPTEPHCCQTDGYRWSTSLGKDPSGQRCWTVSGDRSYNQTDIYSSLQWYRNITKKKESIFIQLWIAPGAHQSTVFAKQYNISLCWKY